MLKALSSALSGLQVNQTALDVASDNIANANTYGFKKSTATFASALYQTTYSGSAAGQTTGGINPVQVGLGVNVSAIARDTSQGSLTATGNALDLAIQGDGYFTVTDGTQTYYTRLGSFSVDSDGSLVLDGTGYKLVGNTYSLNLNASGNQMISDAGTTISIPIGSTLAPQATSNITMKGNLDSTNASLTGTSLQSILPLTTTSGDAANEDTLLTDLSIFNGATGTAGDSLTIYLIGTQPDGTAYSTSATIHPWDDPNLTNGNGTVGELIDALNGALIDADGAQFAKVSIDDGQISAEAVSSGESFSLFIGEQDPFAFSGADLPDNFLDSDSGFDVNAWSYSDATNTDFDWYRMRLSTDPVSSSITVYDSQGSAHNLNVVYYPTGTRTDPVSGEISTVWDMVVAASPDEGTPVDDLVTGITFDNQGRFTGTIGTTAAGTLLSDVGFVGDPSSSSIQIDWANTGSSSAVDLFLGTANSIDGLTGYGSDSTATTTDQDGYAVSSLSSISVSSEGDIVGLYDNGMSLKIAQITLSTFTNPAGLLATDGTMFQASASSGQAITRAAGQSSGTLSTGVLEGSNVDLASEFSRLIIAQSGYQAAAKVIQTEQSILDTTINLIR